MSFISSRIRRRLFAAAASAVLLLTVTTGATGATGGGQRHEPRPTVVLLHGAFADAGSWAAVTRRLQRDGYAVVAPAVALRGIASDTAYLEGVLDSIPGPKILVGHSYGGALVSQLADEPDVLGLVYVAAFIPQAGESLGALSSQFPGSDIGPDTTTTISYPGGVDVAMRQQAFRAVFAADLPRAEAGVLAASQRPVAASVFSEPVPQTAPAGIPAYAVVPTQDHALAPAAERFMANRAGARIVEVAGASHLVALSRPSRIAAVIEDAAR